MTRRALDGIFRPASESMLVKLAKSSAALRPTLSVDPATNTPALSLSPSSAPAPETLEDALDYVGRQALPFRGSPLRRVGEGRTPVRPAFPGKLSCLISWRQGLLPRLAPQR